MNRIPEFPQLYLEYLDQARRQSFVLPLALGGTSGSSGGAGSPPGGFLGMLIQTKIAYDTSELASVTITSGSTSLLDNLNHIRKRISTLEAATTTGSGAAGQIAFWGSTTSLSGNSGFLYNSTTGRATLATSGSSAGLMVVDTLLYRKSSRTLDIGGALEIDETLKVGGVQVDLVGATLNQVLTYNGTKWLAGAGGGGGSGISGSGAAYEVAYFTSGSVITGNPEFNYYPGGTGTNNLELTDIGAARGANISVKALSSGSTSDASVYLQSAGGPTGGITYIEFVTSTANYQIGTRRGTDNFEIKTWTGGGVSVLNIETSGSVLWASKRQSWGGNFVQFDAPIELDPTGATSGQVLSYNGSKWTPTTTSGSSASGIPVDGWIAASETWTYVSADGPTGVFSVPADVTGKYSAGMRVKYTQTTIKYGIVTAVGAYAAGVTPITIYGGTDYTLANAAITSPYYSPVKAPFGFPLDPMKWTVEVTDTTQRSQVSPVSGTWYNLGSISISIPIGVWNVIYKLLAQCNGTSGSIYVLATLSTANNSETDKKLTDQVGAGAVSNVYNVLGRESVLAVAVKTSYYLNSSTTADQTLYNRNEIATAVIRAVCAYL